MRPHPPAILLLAMLAPLAAAQEVLMVAPRLDAVFRTQDHGIVAQEQRRLFRLARQDERFLAAGPLPWRSLEEGALVYDVQDELLVAGEKAARYRDRSFEGPCALEPGECPSPRRLPWILRGGASVFGGREQGIWSRGDGSRIPFDNARVATARLGWGLGDPVRFEVELPEVHGRLDDDGLPELLVARRGRLVRIGRDGEADEVRIPDFDAEDGFLGVPHEVPMLVADLAGGKGEEVLIVDVSAGRAFVLDPRQETPLQVLIVGGAILMSSALDLDGDGRNDLGLLRLPPLGLVAQVRVLKDKVVSAEFLGYRREADGLERAPRWTIPVTVPIRIGIDDEERSLGFLGLVAATPGPAVLVVLPDGKAAWHTDGSAPAEAGDLGPGGSPAPFGLFAHGDPGALAWWRSAAEDRLLLIRRSFGR